MEPIGGDVEGQKFLPFTAEEKAVVDEAFNGYQQALVIIMRLRGLKATAAAPVVMNEDRTGFLVGAPEAPLVIGAAGMDAAEVEAGIKAADARGGKNG
jgi:hypothetical protein